MVYARQLAPSEKLAVLPFEVSLASLLPLTTPNLAMAFPSSREDRARTLERKFLEEIQCVRSPVHQVGRSSRPVVRESDTHRENPKLLTGTYEWIGGNLF